MTDLSFRQADPGIEVSVKPGMAQSQICAWSPAILARDEELAPALLFLFLAYDDV
jgi:hypothetical protein